MTSGSLIPDRQLTFSPELAETIGLEEAVLLQQLGAQLSPRAQWTPVRLDTLQRSLPFWSIDHIVSLCTKLVALGILDESPGSDPGTLLLAAAGSAKTPEDAQSHQASLPSSMTTRWQPTEDLIQLLTLNHGIPRAFVERTAENFIAAGNGRELETRFRQDVLSHWRREQSRRPAFDIPEPPAFDRAWQPSVDALEILQQAGIDADFAESVRAEFILYWRERGGLSTEVNSRFVEHVRRRWLRHTSQMHHSTEPTRLARNWTPDPAVFETLKMAGIDETEAKALLPEFVMYWVDSNEVHTSWNSKFLQHVKRQCGGAGYGDQNGGTTGRGGAGAGGRTKDRSLSEDLTDTSWAN
jgi:hypothetical protein